MYFIVLAAMLTLPEAGAPLPMPSIVTSYSSLDKCIEALESSAMYDGFTKVKHPMFGRSIVRKYGKEGVTLLFCARDMRSV